MAGISFITVGNNKPGNKPRKIGDLLPITYLRKSPHKTKRNSFLCQMEDLELILTMINFSFQPLINNRQYDSCNKQYHETFSLFLVKKFLKTQCNLFFGCLYKIWKDNHGTLFYFYFNISFYKYPHSFWWKSFCCFSDVLEVDYRKWRSRRSPRPWQMTSQIFLCSIQKQFLLHLVL